ncbi:MAG: hypothetical protein IT377_33950 [Polyangiaceae bacterium]|nr:hypothetical protein [Polyangiaceae bacterium]
MAEKDDQDQAENGEAGAAEAPEAKDEPAKDEPAKDEPAKAKVKIPEVHAEKAPERPGAAWGLPFVKADAAWTKWEMWLCAVVVLLEVLVLSMWVGLKGLSTAADGSSKAGLVFRALSGALIFGLAAHFALKSQKQSARSGATVAASVVGLLLAKTWGHVGVDWASNLLNWFQQASFLTLLGGLRGVGTRLTLLLTLLGGSLATAAGKHITIDLLTRYLRPKHRLPVVLTGWLGASVIVGIGAWGFFDHIAIDEFDARAEAPAGEKFSAVGTRLGEHFFVARKQIALDLKTLPHVVKGERYSDWMDSNAWNAWVDENGFAERYGADKAKLLKTSGDMKKTPIVVVPEKGEPRGELVKAANLVFPIGLLIISLRFLLLCLLALSGHKKVDSEAHADMNVVPGGKTSAKLEDEPAEEKA